MRNNLENQLESDDLIVALDLGCACFLVGGDGDWCTMCDVKIMPKLEADTTKNRDCFVP
jgi:hypothetical protein